MKKLIVFCLAVFAAVSAMAQGGNTGDGGADGDYISLAKKIAGLEKKSENFNLFVNYTAAYQQTLNPYAAAFRAKALRLEIKGSFGEHLSYRFRHRLNGSGAPASEDNFAKATDMAMVGWRFNDKFEILGGKICQFWGGFEYDENPMYIYEYCDLLDRMDIFFGGAAFVYHPVPSQEFVFNITNTFNGKFADEYVPNYTRVSVEMALPESTDESVCGIFQEKLAEYPYPVPMKLDAYPAEGTSYTIVSFNHPGGNLTIPYEVPRGTTLVLSVADKVEARKVVE